MNKIIMLFLIVLVLIPARSIRAQNDDDFLLMVLPAIIAGNKNNTPGNLNPRPDVILEDDFDEDHFDEWCDEWNDCGAVQDNPGDAIRDTVRKIQGTHALKLTIPSGDNESGKLRYAFEANPSRTVFARFWYYCTGDDPGNGWDPDDANKIMILMADDTFNSSPTTSDSQFILDIVHYPGSLLGQFQVEHSYYSGSTQYTNYRQNQGGAIVREIDTWYKIEIYIDVGTPGNADGIIRLWIDDVLKAEHVGQSFLPNTPYSQNPEFWKVIVTNMSNQVYYERRSWYDDLLLATDIVAGRP